MNEPFKFIAEHPQDFSPAMQAMAKYQFITAEDSRPLGDLPMYWNEGDQLRQSLLQKSRVSKSEHPSQHPPTQELRADQSQL